MSFTFDRSRRRIVGLWATMAGLALLVPVPAQAGTATLALCTVNLPDVQFRPPMAPFVLTPTTGTVTSDGPTGSVACTGKIGGDQVTGVGSVDIEYTRTGTCAAHLGEGAVSWKIPTEHGHKKLMGSLYVTRIGVSVAAKLEFPHARADLAGALYKLEGDCLLTPLSRVSVLVTGVLAGA